MPIEIPIEETLTRSDFFQLCRSTKSSVYIKAFLDFPFDKKFYEWIPVDKGLFIINGRLKDARQVIIQRYEIGNCIFIDRFIK